MHATLRSPALATSPLQLAAQALYCYIGQWGGGRAEKPLKTAEIADNSFLGTMIKTTSSAKELWRKFEQEKNPPQPLV